MIKNHQEPQASKYKYHLISLKIQIPFNLAILLIGIWIREVIWDIKKVYFQSYLPQKYLQYWKPTERFYIYSKSSIKLMFK